MRLPRLLLPFALALLTATAAVAFTTTASPTSPAGKPAAIDLPANQHIRNTGGSDGAGLCVFTSLEVASRWQNENALTGLQLWMTHKPGGGYPEKVDAMIGAFAKSKGITPPIYLQHTGGDETVLELAIRTGRMPGVTYAGNDGFYKHKIAHMVNLAHIDDTDAAIIDNNRPGSWVWMSRGDFLQRWRDMQGGWAVVLLASPPPPSAKPVSFGQCPGGVCPLAAAPSPATKPSGYFWYHFHGSDRDYWILELDGHVVGKLDELGWKPASGPSSFAADYAGAPPVNPPESFPPKPMPEAIDTNFGIDVTKIHQGRRYSISGVEVDRDSALDAMGANLTDDSGRYHLTIVSDDDTARRTAIQTIGTDPALAALKDRVHVQGYRSTDWPVKTRGLNAGITLQKPHVAGGAKIWETAEISTANVAEALKRTDPNYPPPATPIAPPKPEPAPTPAPVPAPPATPSPSQPNHLLGLLLAGGALYLVYRLVKGKSWTHSSPNLLR